MKGWQLVALFVACGLLCSFFSLFLERTAACGAMEEEIHDASSDSEASSGEISEGQSEEEDFDEEALLGDDAQDGVDFDVDSYKKAPEPTKEDMLRDGIRQILSGVNLSALLAGTEEDEEALRMEDKYQRRAAKMKKKEKKQKKADKKEKEDDTKKESEKKEKVDKKVPKKGTGEEKDKKAASATIDSTKKEPKSEQQKEPQKKGEEKEKAAEATQSSQKKRKRSDTETDPQATSEKSTSATNESPAKNQKKLDNPLRRKFRVKPSEAKPVEGMSHLFLVLLLSFHDRQTIEGICRMPAM